MDRQKFTAEGAWLKVGQAQSLEGGAGDGVELLHQPFQAGHLLGKVILFIHLKNSRGKFTRAQRAQNQHFRAMTSTGLEFQQPTEGKVKSQEVIKDCIKTVDQRNVWQATPPCSLSTPPRSLAPPLLSTTPPRSLIPPHVL